MIKKKEAKKEIKSKEQKEVETELGTAGFTLGILSLLFIGISGIFLSVLGGIFCLIQKRKKQTKINKIGLILNIIGLVLSMTWMVVYYFVIYPYLTKIGYSI